jgi:hypothetical protein
VSDHPPGDYAIVEIMGHVTLVGRIAEVERFGVKLIQIEVVWRDTLLPPVYHGGAAIYGVTPCSPDIAFAKQARKPWQLPTALLAVVAPLLLEGVEPIERVDTAPPDYTGGWQPDRRDGDAV